MGERFYWAFFEANKPEPHPDGDGVFRRTRDGWKNCDLNGSALTKDKLAGSLTKLAAFRGTSCKVDVAEYVIRRVNGESTPEVTRALEALRETKAATIDLIRLLGPKDFELLVDLVFSSSGWRRIGALGKTQKTLDLDIVLPSTGERALVQVKSKTSTAELARYASKLDEAGPYSRMFFVYHTGNVVFEDERVVVLGPEQLTELVIEAGLTNWLIDKTR